MRLNVILALTMTVLLAACGPSRTERMAMAVNDATPVAAGARLTNAMVVGEVSGGSTYLNLAGISDNEFKEALQNVLASKSLLATSAAGRYRIEANMDFTYHGFDSMKVDGPVVYKIIDQTNNAKVFEQTVMTDISNSADVSDYILPKTLLFGSSAISNAQRASYERAAIRNIGAFMRILNNWMPPQ